MPTRWKKACFHFPECSLSYAKIMPTRGKKACSHFPECRLSYAKIMPTSGKKACFHFPECSLSYAKIMQICGKSKHDFRYLFFLTIKQQENLVCCFKTANSRAGGALKSRVTPASRQGCTPPPPCAPHRQATTERSQSRLYAPPHPQCSHSRLSACCLPHSYK